MDEFIKAAVGQFGIDESTARNATGTALGFIKNGLGDQFSAVSEKLPKSEQLIDDADAAPQSNGGGGLMGSVSSTASSLLGGGGGGGAAGGLELMSALQKTGLSTEQTGSFMTMLVNFIKEKVGEGVVSQITAKIPALKAVLH